MTFSSSRSGCPVTPLPLPLPLPKSLYGRVHKRTLKSQPRFLASIYSFLRPSAAKVLFHQLLLYRQPLATEQARALISSILAHYQPISYEKRICAKQIDVTEACDFGVLLTAFREIISASLIGHF